MRVELRDVAVPVPGNSSFAAAAAASGNSSVAAAADPGNGSFAAADDPGNSSRDVAAAAVGCDRVVFGRDCGGIKPKIRFKR